MRFHTSFGFKYTALVGWLVEVDPVFSENSPFYLASLYGQTDVVRQLLSYHPSTSAFNFTQGEHIQENTSIFKSDGH
jgi:hypothetical protein